MSKYTTEVRFICENLAGLTNSEGYTSTKEIIANSREKLFDFDYPIFDESYRSVLETKILKHFYTREIGAESVGLWKLWLDTRMNEIMPYFNQMYKSTLFEFNPLYDTDITTTHTKDETGNKTDTAKDKITTNEESETTVEESKSGSGDSTTTVNSSGTGSDDKWNYYSDTPQGGINGLQNLNYLTNATHTTDATNGTSAETTANQYQNSENNDSTTSYENDVTTNKDSSNDSNFTTNEEYVEHVTGKRFGESYSKMLMDFRNTFVNIDLDVIHALDDLFFNLW